MAGVSTQRGPGRLPKLTTNISSTSPKSKTQQNSDGQRSSSSSRNSSFLTTPHSSANSNSSQHVTSCHDYAHYLTYGPTTQERAITSMTTHSPDLLVGLSRKPTPLFVNRQLNPSAAKESAPHPSSAKDTNVTGRGGGANNHATPLTTRDIQYRLETTRSTSPEGIRTETSSSVPFPRTHSLTASSYCSTPGLSRYPTVSSGASIFRHRPKLGPQHFLVSRQVAKGGFGRVHEGVEVQSGNVVAIKTVQRQGLARHRVDAVLREQVISKKVSENRSTSGVGAEFVVRMVSSFLTPSHFVFVLDYHGAGDLRDVDFPLKTEDARFYIGEMALGLRYLHSQNIVLRDLKPANALLGFDGHVRLADFGLATIRESPKHNTYEEKSPQERDRERTSSVLSFTTRARSGSLRSMADSLRLPKLSLGGGRKRSNTTQEASVGQANLGRSKSWGLGNARMYRNRQKTVLCGTPGYISPEGYQGRHGPEGDIWALGITLYEFITGVNPFDTWGEPTKEIKTKVLYSEPFYPEGMPKETKSILEKLLRKKWKRRVTLEEMMAHSFFKAEDHFWERLQKKELKPPPLPDVALERLQRASKHAPSHEMPLILYLEQESMTVANDGVREELSETEIEAFYMDEMPDSGSEDASHVWH